MLYKTMVLGLLEQHPTLHDQLRQSRTLLTTVNRLAGELRTSHLAWKERLIEAQPEAYSSAIHNEAMELALQELVDSLPVESDMHSEESSADSRPLIQDREVSG